MKKHLWGMICLILILALTGCQSGGQASEGSAGESTAAETSSLFGQNGGGKKFQEFLGEDEEAYRALTEGIQGQAESVPASADQAKNDFMAAWIQVSPYGALLQDIRVENGTFVLSYAYEKETQDAYLARLQEDLKKCKETLPDSANEWETAMAVYRYYASRFAPASAWNQAEQPDGIPLLLALESGEGTSLSYTQGCQFALNELGVDAFLLKNGGGSEEIRWCLAARLGDSYYYLNPALENGSDDGQGLQYFGGSEAREPISYEPAVGGPYLPWGEQASGSENVCSDERFDFMKNIISWSFEESAAHTVRLVDLDGKESLFHTDTGVWDGAREQDDPSDLLEQMTPAFDSIIRKLMEDEGSSYDPENLDFVSGVLYLATVNYGYLLPGVSYEEAGSVQIPEAALRQIYSACFGGSGELPEIAGKSGFAYDASTGIYQVPLSDMGDGWVHVERFEESDGGLQVLTTFADDQRVYGTYLFHCEKNEFTSDDAGAVYRYAVKLVEVK